MSDEWVKKWLCHSTDGGVTFHAVELECKRAPDGWMVDMRPGCKRSRFIDIVPFDKVYDTREEAEAKI